MEYQENKSTQGLPHTLIYLNALLVNCAQDKNMKQVTGTSLWWNATSICCATYWMYKPTFKSIPQNIKIKVWKTLQRQRPDCDEIQIWYVMPPTGCIYQVSSSCIKTCRKKLRKLSGGGELCWFPLSECLRPPRGQNYPAMAKSSTVIDNC